MLATPTPLLAEDPSPATRSLFAAVERNDLSAVEASIAQGARIDAHNPFGMRAVDIAIDRGYYEIAHYLLSLRNLPQTAANPDNAPSPADGPIATPPVPPAVTAPLQPPAADRPNPFDPQAVPEGARHPTVEGGKLPPSLSSAPPPPAPVVTDVPQTDAGLPAVNPPSPAPTPPIARPVAKVKKPTAPPMAATTTSPPAPPPPAPPAVPEPPVAPPASLTVSPPSPAAPPQETAEIPAEPTDTPTAPSSSLAEPPAPPDIASPVPTAAEVPGSAPSMADADAVTESSPAPTASLPVVAGDGRTATEGGFIDGVSSRIKQATRSFDRTFDHFLGGWFFKWMGEKIEGSEKPAPAKKETQVAATTPPETASPIVEEPDPLKIFSESETRDDKAAAGSETVTPASPNAGDIPPVQETPALADVSPPAESPGKADTTAETATTTPSAASPEANGDTAPEGGDIATGDPMLADLPETGDLPSSPDAAGPSAPAAMPVVAPTPRRPAPAPVAAKPAPKTPSSPPAKAAQDTAADVQLPAAVAALPDPFAPDAVPPGAEHPLIGEEAPAVPAPLAAAPPAVNVPARTTAKPAAPEAMARPAPAEASRPAVSAKAARAARAATPAKPPKGADSLENLLGQLADVPDTGKTPPAAAQGGGGLFGLDGPATPATPAKPSGGGGLLGLGGPSTSVAALTTATVPSVISRQVPDTVLTLGESAHITAAKPPEASDPAERNYCVRKNRGTVVFCIEPIDWPPPIAKEVRVSSIMYQGAQAVVRYDDQQATRFHAIFPTEAYGKLVAYYTKRFGQPTSKDERTIAPFSQPRQSNPVTLWQRMDPLSNEMTTLEIRKFDDARGGFPDMHYGAIMLYNASSPPIFPLLSTLDLMPTSAPN